LRAALAPFNDVIVREAVHRGLRLFDLRVACNEPGDYTGASPIEPSEPGGGEIAATIAEWVASDAAAFFTVVYSAGQAGP
jgi:hypothetical protein